MPVNHHLEVRITRNDTWTIVGDVSPTIRVRNKATGVSRDLPQVMAMYGVQTGPTDIHYGQNVYLPDGMYQVMVMIGSDTASFRDVTVAGGAPLMPSTAVGATAPTNSMPAMGGDIATDGQRLADQPAAVQSLFMTVWGSRACPRSVRSPRSTSPRPSVSLAAPQPGTTPSCACI